MKETSATIYANGAVIRLHNRRMAFGESDGITELKFVFADSTPDIPACAHFCIRGKVRETYIKMSTEAMEALVSAYVRYKVMKPNP